MYLPSVPKTSRGMPLVKIVEFKYWEVQGESRRGRPTKREGKRVVCGHKHKTEAACKACLKKMRELRPGNCQVYNTNFLEGISCLYSSKKK